ncbi:glycoside hydrolase family 2 protein [uncultured Victivallis sp.]|uniref:beta-mannosidase n=1 Tax=uncultured Victivallis sp. TaxID=354118 RepID=UPI0025EA7EA4|nr:glycoside hydrolase family 2 protein [uncultured Victivallis sp.]
MELDLTQIIWTLSGHDQHGNAIAVPCRLPGDNATALMEAGIIPDPYVGTNEKLVQWIAERDWIFTGKFSLPEEPAEKLLYLNFDSIDTCAEILINGKKAGESDNMFIRQRIWASPFLRRGENSVELHIRSAVKVGEERAKRYPFDLGQNSNNSVPYLQYVRKVQSHGGWDWGICLPVSGVYGGLYLREVRTARIEKVYTEQKFSGDTVELTVSVELEAAAAGLVPLRIEFNGELHEETVEVLSGRQLRHFRFIVRQPELWNPAGYGGQFLYPLTVSSDSEQIVKKIGFRHVELLTESDGATSESFCFRINGNRIFCKGANWVPPDAMPGRMPPERLCTLVKAARDANMNMLRVWGGGNYESELFYELCDEFGLMVWQDCMFSCVKYPDMPEFLESVEHELEYQVRRLSTHPCMTAWCGDNEIFMCFGQMPVSPERFQGAVLYDRVNRFVVQCLKKYNRELPVRRSSPDNGETRFHENVFEQDRGDMHYWSVWHGDEPFSAYYGIRPRFCSEFGFQSFPSIRTLRKCISPEMENISSPEMENHQKNGIGNAKIYATFARYFRMPSAFEDVVYLSQVQQAMAIRMAVEFWRSLKPWCMGTLYWQMNDVWPVASWSSVDYNGEWKILNYEAKRFFAPLLIAARVEPDGKYYISVIRDGLNAVSGTVRILFHSFAKRTVKPVFERTVTVDPESAFNQEFSPSDEPAEAGFYELRFEGEETVRREFFAAEYKRCELPEPEISVEIRPINTGFEIELTASDYAFCVFAEQRAALCNWSDNAVTLYPYERIRLTVTPDRPMSVEEFRTGLKLSHIQSTFSPRPETARKNRLLLTEVAETGTETETISPAGCEKRTAS